MAERNSCRRHLAAFALVAAMCVPCRALSTEVDASIAMVRQLTDELLVADGGWGDGSQDAVCGVISACRALKFCGFPCDPSQFVSLRYMGSWRGSTPAELAAIGDAVGARTNILAGLSAWDLRWVTVPVVANVRSSPSSAAYDHWVVARWVDGKIDVTDGDRAAVQMPVAEFLGIWNGVAVVYCDSDDSVKPLIWIARVVALQCGMLLMLCIAAIVRRIPFVNWLRDSFEIVVLTVVIAVASLFVFADLPHIEAGADIAVAPHVDSRHSSAPLSELSQAVESGDVLLVDARMSRDYRSGSVPRAVNIPVHASLWEIRKFLEVAPREIPMLVFCQSQSCPFAETVASNLRLLGYHNVSVCEAGVNEYRSLP